MIDRYLFERGSLLCGLTRQSYGRAGATVSQRDPKPRGHIAHFGGKIRAHNVRKFRAEHRSADRELRKAPGSHLATVTRLQATTSTGLFGRRLGLVAAPPGSKRR